LAKVGRYFRISDTFRLAVGRDEKENMRLEALAKETDTIFEPHELPGPTAVGRGTPQNDDELIAARIIARYTLRGAGEAKVKVKFPPKHKEKAVTVEGISETDLKQLRI